MTSPAAYLGTGREFVGPLRGGRFRAQGLHADKPIFAVYDAQERGFVRKNGETVHLRSAEEADRKAKAMAVAAGLEAPGDAPSPPAPPPEAAGDPVGVASWAFCVREAPTIDVAGAHPYGPNPNCSVDVKFAGVAVQLSRTADTVVYLHDGEVQAQYAGEGRAGVQARMTTPKFFDEWYAPLPTKRLREIAGRVRKTAVAIGASAYALQVLRCILEPGETKEREAMETLNQSVDRAFKNTKTRAPKKAEPKKAAAPKAVKPTPAPKAAKLAGKAAAPKKDEAKVPKATAKKEKKAVVLIELKKPLKDGEKIATQAGQILAALARLGGRAPLDKLLAEAAKSIKTIQPIEKIWSFYRKRLIDDGRVKVSA